MVNAAPLTEEEVDERKAHIRRKCAPNWMEHPQLAWFWEAIFSKLSPSAKLTALVLWGFTRGELNPVRPTVTTLAALTGFKYRAVRNHLVEIDKAGFLDREIGGGNSASRYQLKLPADVLEVNMAEAGCATPAPTCIPVCPPPALPCLGSSEASYLVSRRDDHDLPTEEYCRERFSELQKKIAKVDKNGILSRFLWHEKGFIGFTKLGDQHGFEEVMAVAISVAVRENSRCVKDKGSIKTWGYFKNDMVKEMGEC